MKTVLSSIDVIVIAAYFAVTLCAGLFMGRFVKNGKDFFSGGNRVPWWMGAISSYMAMISSFVFIAHGGIAYEDGIVAIVVFWSCAFAVLAGTWIFASRWRRAKVATPMEYLERRYGAWVRQFISWCGIGFRILDNMVRLYTLGLMASVLLGISIGKGIWLGVAVVLAYTMAGGLWSVLVTDVIQCVILLGMSIAVLPIALHAVGGRREGFDPPVRVCLDDAVAAIRLVQTRAQEWNVDPRRIGLTGGSAGACSSLYAALQDDCALGVRAVFAQRPQTSLDPTEMREWIPNIKYGHSAFGYKTFDDWLAHREDSLPWIGKFSPIALLRECTTSKAPIFLYYAMPDPPKGKLPKDPTHAGIFCTKFREACERKGIVCRPDDFEGFVRRLLVTNGNAPL